MSGESVLRMIGFEVDEDTECRSVGDIAEFGRGTLQGEWTAWYSDMRKRFGKKNVEIDFISASHPMYSNSKALRLRAQKEHIEYLKTRLIEARAEFQEMLKS